MERKFSWITLALMIIYYENPIICDSTLDELIDILPGNINSESYEVFIHHELDDTEPGYWGEVRMKVLCNVPTKVIVLHGAGFHLEIWDVSVAVNTESSEENKISVTDVHSLSNNRWRISLDAYLMKNFNYTIKITFSKVFSTANIGYICKKCVRSEISASKFIIFTHLNEIGGRYVFPCLDQLDMKAKFKMTLTYPKGLKGFTNAKSETTGDDPYYADCIEEKFEETSPMAPFSIAIALLPPTDFARIGFNYSYDVPVQTWADSSVIQEIYPLNNTFSIIFKYFSKFFQLPHPLNKLDIIVLPDLSVPIEKSFGLIFMSETFALSTVKENLSIKFDRVAEICHAISYQWIGHTVTISDWQYNWWHEGLNYFLQRKCLKKVYKDFKDSHLELNLIESFLSFMRNEETNEEYEPFSVVESFPDFHPMIYVTKEKVYHFIRMIRFIVGPKLFRLSLARYVETYKFQNAHLVQTFYLFNEIARENGMNVSIPFEMLTIMETWMNQKGIHPLIIVKRNSKTKEVTVSRENFDLLKLDDEKQKETKCWPLPFRFITKIDHRAQKDKNSTIKWLPCDERASKEVSTGVYLKKEDWILFTLKLDVPGRVLYWKENWIAIQKTLLDQNEYEGISFLSRVRMISDMFALAEGGLLSYEIVFDTMMYLKHEKKYACWSVAMKEFDRIRSRLLGTSLFKAYKEFMRGFLEPVFQKQIFNNLMEHSTENHLESLFEILIMEFSCKFDIKACREKSLDLYKEARRDERSGVTNIRISHSVYKVILCEHYKDINEDWIKTFWQIYSMDTARDSDENLFEAFGCSQNDKILINLLEQSILTDSKIPSKSKMKILRSVASNEKGYLLMKEFFKTNYEKIPSFNSDISLSRLSYLNILLDATNREKDFNELKKFSIGMNMGMNMWKEAKSRSMRNAQKNIIWNKKNKKSMKAAFYKNKSPSIFHTLWRRTTKSDRNK